MAKLLSLLTNDPARAPCQLGRIGLRLEEDRVLGVGTFVDDAALVAKRPAGVPVHEGALDEFRSPVLLLCSRSPEFRFDEDLTDPFRFRNWLFAMDGAVEGFESIRDKLELPEVIARQIRGPSDREHLFALFLRFLKERGGLDDPDLAAPEGAHCLALALREVDRLTRESDRPLPSPLAAVATNGRVLLAIRRGRPLHYALLEGLWACERCGEDAQAAHRRGKAVVLASEPLVGAGFLEVPDGSTAAVGRGLDVTVASI